MADPLDLLSADLISAVKNGSVDSRDSFQNLKLRLCKKYSLNAVPPNSDILARVATADRDLLLPFLIKKPSRTVSGVAAVAVMTSPHDCPHGKCSYCPGGVSNDSAQSYTGKEPAARRAARNCFDPWSQVTDRVTQLEEIGHNTDKIDLIIMGGTFTSRDPEYQEWFVKRCFDALNGEDSETLEEAQDRNRTASRRCVGMTVETRPDVFTPEQIERAMSLGATRVELGVQILDDEILKGVDRGHGTEEVRRCTRDCKEHGLKICYHIMPGLPGSDPVHDLECFRRIFDDPSYRPDMLKFYTLLVVEGTGVYDMWKRGEYVPYDEDTAADLLAEMKSIVPEYVRIQRIQRDIPATEIVAGITKSNIRQEVESRMKARGISCRCIRCREAGRVDADVDPETAEIKDLVYEASGGKEHFISIEQNDSIIGYIRLRLDRNPEATIRELKVFGHPATIGGDDGEWQHRGFGRRLVSEAERIAREADRGRIRVTSGVGVREYYRSLGYSEDLPYMAKDLRSPVERHAVPSGPALSDLLPHVLVARHGLGGDRGADDGQGSIEMPLQHMLRGRILAIGIESRLAAERGEIRSDEAVRDGGYGVQIHSGQRHPSGVDLQYPSSRFHIGLSNKDELVESAWSKQGGIYHIGAVGRAHYRDVPQSFDAVHRCEKLGYHPLPGGAVTASAHGRDGIELVEEYDAWGHLLGAFEYLADRPLALAQPFAGHLRAIHRYEVRSGFVGQGLGYQRLAGAGRAVEQDALPRFDSQALVGAVPLLGDEHLLYPASDVIESSDVVPSDLRDLHQDLPHAAGLHIGQCRCEVLHRDLHRFEDL